MMRSNPPEILVRRGGDSGLAWTVLVSAGVHLLGFALVILAPQRFLRTVPPLQSYTVDLVAPDKLGGTRMHGGRLFKVPAPATKENAVLPQSPPKAIEPAKQEPPKVAAKKLTVAKSAPEPRQPKEKPVARKQEMPALKVAERKSEAKAKEPAKPKQPATRHRTSRSPEESRPVKPEAAGRAPAPRDPALEEAAKRDRAILAAVQRRAAQVQGSPQAVGAPAGALSAGPGEGVGGQLVGWEYLLYYNQMIARIKENWMWTGAAGSLEAVVRFDITPMGEIVNVHVVRSSGDTTYDGSVERAVRAVKSLGAPPEQFGDGVELTFRPDDLRS